MGISIGKGQSELKLTPTSNLCILSSGRTAVSKEFTFVKSHSCICLTIFSPVVSICNREASRLIASSKSNILSSLGISEIEIMRCIGKSHKKTQRSLNEREVIMYHHIPRHVCRPVILGAPLVALIAC